jgi:hypothetical protein
MSEMDWSTKSWLITHSRRYNTHIFLKSSCYLYHEKHWGNLKYASRRNLINKKRSHWSLKKIGLICCQKFPWSCLYLKLFDFYFFFYFFPNTFISFIYDCDQQVYYLNLNSYISICILWDSITFYISRIFIIFCYLWFIDKGIQSL